MKRILIIEADTNDADYITSETDITDWPEETLDALTKITSVIKECTNYHNWPNSEYDNSLEEVYSELLSQEDIEFFSDICPYGEYGIHTIVSVRILTIVEEVNLV